MYILGGYGIGREAQVEYALGLGIYDIVIRIDCLEVLLDILGRSLLALSSGFYSLDEVRLRPTIGHAMKQPQSCVVLLEYAHEGELSKDSQCFLQDRLVDLTIS